FLWDSAGSHKSSVGVVILPRAFETTYDCKRFASIDLPQRCHRVPPNCTAGAETGSRSVFRRNTRVMSPLVWVLASRRRSQVRILPRYSEGPRKQGHSLPKQLCTRGLV